MKQYLIITLLFLMFIFGGCSSQGGKDIDGTAHIRIKIKKNKTGLLHLVKSREYENEYIHTYANDADAESGKIFMITQTQDNLFLNLIGADLQTLKSVPVVKGKGPGEIQNNIAGVGAAKNRYFVMEFSRNMVHEYDDGLNYSDTYYFNDESIQIGFGFSKVFANDDYLIVGHVLPMKLAKLSYDGILTGKIKGEFNRDKPNSVIYNLCYWDCDTEGNIYLVPAGKKDTYRIEKYDADMNPVWTLDIEDGLSNALSSEYQTFPNRTFELVGGQLCQGIQAYQGKIYVLRGTGGIARVEWENNSKHRYLDPIGGLKNGFVDVFDAKTGKHLERLQGDFLRTDLSYRLAVLEDGLYFISSYQRNNDNSRRAQCNTLYKAVIAK